MIWFLCDTVVFLWKHRNYITYDINVILLPWIKIICHRLIVFEYCLLFRLDRYEGKQLPSYWFLDLITNLVLIWFVANRLSNLLFLLSSSFGTFSIGSLTMDYTEPLQVVYCDLWDPTLMMPSMGYKYYVSFIDAFNRHTWIYIF